MILATDEAMRRCLVSQLDGAGYACVTASSSVEARELLAQARPSLVVWDLETSEGPAHELTRVLSQASGVATVIVGGHDDPDSADMARALHADGYLVKPFGEPQLLVTVASALRRRDAEVRYRNHRDRMEELVAERTTALRDAVRRLELSNAELHRSRDEVIRRLSRAGEYREEATGAHVERMGHMCFVLAQRLGLDRDRCELIRMAAPLHDVGKVAIPDSILGKPGPLTQEERTVVQEHANLGHWILTGSETALLDVAATIAWTHQEKFDGGGYPLGLAGEEIPIEGRLAAVADVFDTLVHDRVYRPALALEEAVETVRRGSGSHFDPAVVDVFLQVLPEITDIVAVSKETPGNGVKVLIVEDHAGLRKGMELLLRNEGYLIVGSADDAEQGYPLIRRRQPDVAVVDVRLPGESGIDLTRRLQAEERPPRVLLYTGVEDERTLEDAIDAGAAGIASKAGPLAELVTAIGDVARGGTYVDPRLGSHLVRSGADTASVLTPREKEILALLARGLSGEQIAAQLFLSPETVRTHVRNAMTKLSVRTRIHAVTEAVRRREISL